MEKKLAGVGSAEHPILFNAEMVRAILSGNKTETRRPVKPHGRNPFGAPGDRLWIRETWRAEELSSGLDGVRYKANDVFIPIENSIEASEAWIEMRRDDNKWRPSIHMPRWASRITLEVLEVRREPLQNMSQLDALHEGFGPHGCNPEMGARWESALSIAMFMFQKTWDKIYAKQGYEWGSNPMVDVCKFRRADV